MLETLIINPSDICTSNLQVPVNRYKKLGLVSPQHHVNEPLFLLAMGKKPIYNLCVLIRKPLCAFDLISTYKLCLNNTFINHCSSIAIIIITPTVFPFQFKGPDASNLLHLGHQ
jgi:hypothetical protein